MPFGELMNVPLNRLAALAFVDVMATDPLAAVIVQFVQISVPVEILLRAGANAEPVRELLFTVILPVDALFIAYDIDVTFPPTSIEVETIIDPVELFITL